MIFDRELLAGNLRANRARLNISQRELAEKSKITQQTIANYERGLTIPSIENACKLADVFGVSLESLLRRTWEEPEDA